MVKPKDAEEVTKAGIILPDVAQEKPQRGTVLDVGEGRFSEYLGQIFPLTVKPGDVVLYSRYGGVEIEEDGEDLLILREADIIGVADDD